MSFQDFPPALLTLSPRLTRVGAPSASVEGINTTLLGDGCWCYCIEKKGEYQFDRADDTTPADGNLVIAPTAGPGRWLKRLPIVTPSGASALVQLGVDSIATGSVHNATVSDFDHLIRKDTVTPLRVQLPGVTPGNILLVDASGSVNAIPDAGLTGIKMLPVVSFDGTTTYAPGSGFDWIVNAAARVLVFALPGGGQQATNFRCYAAVTIPGGATTATVQLAYTANSGFSVVGQNGNFDPSITLSATELLAAAVPQPGPFTLFPYV